jgi:hypothetical protein
VGHRYKLPRTKRLRALRPHWMKHLDPDERAALLELDEAIDMHRRLLRPLLLQRSRMMGMAKMREWRANNLRQAAAAVAADAA